eukprot:CAMPEP_0173100378 /NCGR_PEP_ID=MMETSP1102-20130122/36165_1 /TAXON_ID=49646 /ORGANISM="Geminigera sp., Strain Caron Lab Isolate" /LENGTH=43 /DNA_ID= /DNA_START= /DNA_END= /DNA_ORIENTATION=
MDLNLANDVEAATPEQNIKRHIAIPVLHLALLQKELIFDPTHR